jgi:hypothetical protein
VNELEKQKLISEIMQLAMAINFQTDYCVFVDFSGHVDELSIRIVESKENYKERVCASSTYLNREYTMQRLEDMKIKLIEILETKEIDTSIMNYRIEEIRHYIF